MAASADSVGSLAACNVMGASVSMYTKSCGRVLAPEHPAKRPSGSSVAAKSLWEKYSLRMRNGPSMIE
jgi:hypothetical protein